MKKLLVVTACLLATVLAHGQGQVSIGNRVLTANPVIDAKVSLPDGTGADSSIIAQLWGAPTGQTLVALETGVGFRDGAGAGYFPTHAATLTGIPGGTVLDVELRAFEASFGSYDAAVSGGGLFGKSALLVGNVTAQEAPNLPEDALSGMTGFSLVPEPSAIALGLLGAAALLLRRRK